VLPGNTGDSTHLTTAACPQGVGSGVGHILGRIMQLGDRVPGLGLQPVVQELAQDPSREGCLTSVNTGEFHLGPLGTWRLGVRGTWKDRGDGCCALVGDPRRLGACVPVHHRLGHISAVLTC
jgi:hypothetical protein